MMTIIAFAKQVARGLATGVADRPELGARREAAGAAA